MNALLGAYRKFENQQVLFREPSKVEERASVLVGRWVRDRCASDSKALHRAMDLIGLGRAEKFMVARMLEGLAIQSKGAGNVAVHYLTKIPKYRVGLIEEFHKDSETVMCRRDMRSGRQRARLASLSHRIMQVDIQLEGELPGRVVEEFRVNHLGQLEVISTMEIKGKMAKVRQVYRRG